jgi:hypothetical protein
MKINKKRRGGHVQWLFYINREYAEGKTRFEAIMNARDLVKDGFEAALGFPSAVLIECIWYRPVVLSGIKYASGKTSSPTTVFSREKHIKHKLTKREIAFLVRHIGNSAK